jgi:hypothetical protein
LSKDGKAAFVKQLREDYEKLRTQHAGSQVKLIVARSGPRQCAEAEV